MSFKINGLGPQMLWSPGASVRGDAGELLQSETQQSLLQSQTQHKSENEAGIKVKANTLVQRCSWFHTSLQTALPLKGDFWYSCGRGVPPIYRKSVIITPSFNTPSVMTVPATSVSGVWAGAKLL